jgi:hypothetical protein
MSMPFRRSDVGSGCPDRIDSFEKPAWYSTSACPRTSAKAHGLLRTSFLSRRTDHDGAPGRFTAAKGSTWICPLSARAITHRHGGGSTSTETKAERSALLLRQTPGAETGAPSRDGGVCPSSRQRIDHRRKVAGGLPDMAQQHAPQTQGDAGTASSR